ncbi:mannonate dehydratase [Cohnella fermenti]|uniref:mannonate dehydratase n=1 Tax=Cohnella fermenti TaxID=2565925 RepID=A0A4S4BPC3_9BACL|nr:mannonate dehydratase [Cohnella fermenti]THF76571.1 mannonate dehydratase [Cohnella fermenti]
MIITDYLRSDPSVQWTYAKQMGVDHAVIRLPEDKEFDCTNPSHWRLVYERFSNYGLVPTVLEPMPNALHDSIKAGDAQRDACIDQVIRMFPIMDRLNIRTVCLNFMAHVGWSRTSHQLQERGGAIVTGFRLQDYPADAGQAISEAELWANLSYFLEAVVPEAEKHNIRLALHPDDPPVSPLGKVSRILTSLQAMQRAVHLVPSDHLGVTMCQGTFTAMGENLEEAIAAFARENKLFFVHFRDVAGDKTDFRETFHDNGPTDMARIIRLYRELGISVPIRVDHVPTLAGESNDIPGYATLGRLFAVGYLKGLLDGARV